MRCDAMPCDAMRCDAMRCDVEMTRASDGWRSIHHSTFWFTERPRRIIAIIDSAFSRSALVPSFPRQRLS